MNEQQTPELAQALATIAQALATIADTLDDIAHSLDNIDRAYTLGQRPARDLAEDLELVNLIQHLRAQELEEAHGEN